ncbi:MAG: energy-dependent translational throttle protein EttA [Rickettsiales bacterium]
MSSYQYIYVIKGLKKLYGTREIIKDLYLSFFPGAKIGIIGHNGSGKSTLLKIMAGIDKDFTGEAWAAEGTKIGYLAQEPQLDNSKNVFENILESIGEKKDLLYKFNEISARFAEELSDDEMNDLIAEQGELQEKIDHLNAWDLEREIEIAMAALRCPAKDANVAELSGGEKRRVALCKLLLSAPDILLLDEPTNHLDAESISWLEEYLKNYKGTVILVTHDRYFLDTVVDWILELERGDGIPWKGNYSSWLEQKQKRLAEEEKSESSRQKQLKEELEWVRQSPKARQAKSKARITAYEQLRDKEREKSMGVAQIIIPDGPRLGNNVIEGINLSKSYDGKDLFKDFNFKIVPGAIVGIIGPNGVGKTTLFRLITGQETADEGSIKLGESVKLGYVDQSRDNLKAGATVWEEISEGQEEIQLGKSLVKSRAYCGAFNFKGGDQQKLVGSLSGGERNRVHLAKMLKEGANVILLDEPTNDLDVDTLRALEDALLEFSGCAIIISHDRWFLDRIATHIISYEKDHVEFYEGNYQDYDQDRRMRLGLTEDEVEKYKHKKFSRT